LKAGAVFREGVAGPAVAMPGGDALLSARSAGPGRRQPSGWTVEARVVELAARCHGVLTRDELLAAGLTPRMIQFRLQQQRLILLHRGVYLVRSMATPQTPFMAAVLACGRGAVLSHRSALVLAEVLRPGSVAAPVDVTVVGRNAGDRPGIRARRVARLPAEDLTTLEGIPVTTALRAALDLAGDRSSGADARELEQAVAQADRLGLFTVAELSAYLSLHARRRGVARLRKLLDGAEPPVLTRSEAEELLLALVRRARLPGPLLNVPVAGYEVDFLWPDERLVVEVDGYAFHSSRRQFESDRRRDADLGAAGYITLRLTWRQLTEEPEAVLSRIALALGRLGRR
jgi:very-short-patch-repair endonuclease